MRLRVYRSTNTKYYESPFAPLCYTHTMDARFWADVLGVLHAFVVLFVVGGEAIILVGWRSGWAWVRHLWFRTLHAVTVAIIMTIAAAGEWCPLTVWESQLRQDAGQAGFEKGFIATWLERLLYYDAPLEVFAVLYAAFAALVAWTWWKVPPLRR